MSPMPRITLGLALALALPAAVLPSDLVLDRAAGAVFVTVLDQARASDYAVTPDGTWRRLEVVRENPGAPPLIGLSHSTGGLAVHAGAGGSAPLTTALFRNGGGAAANPPFRLFDPQTGLSTAPAAVRTVALDPTEPAGSTVLLDAGHVLLPRSGQFRTVALARRASGEVVLIDHDFAGGPVRRTPLGFTPPIGSNKGSFTVSPSGSVWAAIGSADGIRLFDLGDLSGTGLLQPVQLGFVGMGVDTGWEGTSARMGIIAILIGVVAQPMPAVSYQQGDELVLAAFDGARLRELRRQPLPAGAQGLIEDEGIFYYLLPYLEQDNLYRRYPSAPPELLLEIGR